MIVRAKEATTVDRLLRYAALAVLRMSAICYPNSPAGKRSAGRTGGIDRSKLSRGFVIEWWIGAWIKPGPMKEKSR